jgi:hypothetical protein
MESIPFKGLDQAAVDAWSRALGDPEWFRARRLEALAALEKLERPRGREEAWRFTNPRAAALDRAQVIRSGGPVEPESDRLGAGHGKAVWWRRLTAAAGRRRSRRSWPPRA